MSVESIELRTLTPIFTGDIDGKSNVLQPTSIIGSLRWWTEAVLRSLGYYACDPTSDDRCDADKGYCYACSIFGASGLSKIFKINIEPDLKHIFENRDTITIEFKNNNKKRAWFVSNGLIGKFAIKIVPLRDYFNPILIKLPLIIASKWGSICAKTSLGYGVVDIINDNEELNIEDFINALNKLKMYTNIREYHNDKLPDIKKFFFAKIRFDITDKNWWTKIAGFHELSDDDKTLLQQYANVFIPLSINIRKWLRYDSQLECYRGIRDIYRNIFGSINSYDSRKESSKIHISFAYNIKNNSWELRIWSWLINTLREEVYRTVNMSLNNNSNILPNILQINNNYKLIWHEFNSDRDTERKYSDKKEYINSLCR